MSVARRLWPAATLALATLALAGCGLQPLYGGAGGQGVAANLGAVDVPPIAGQAGWLMRNALRDRLGAGGAGIEAGGTAPRYRLDVRLDDRLESLGVLNNDTVSRERRLLRARYQLVDLASGDIVLDATAGSDAGIDVVSSEYATIAAEERALENLANEVADRIVTQLALALRSPD